MRPTSRARTTSAPATTRSAGTSKWRISRRARRRPPWMVSTKRSCRRQSVARSGTMRRPRARASPRRGTRRRPVSFTCRVRLGVLSRKPTSCVRSPSPLRTEILMSASATCLLRWQGGRPRSSCRSQRSRSTRCSLTSGCSWTFPLRTRCASALPFLLARLVSPSSGSPPPATLSRPEVGLSGTRLHSWKLRPSTSCVTSCRGRRTALPARYSSQLAFLRASTRRP